MTSSQRSMVAAVVLFLLIAAAVIGSMSWATAASYALARQNVGDEHRSRIERALRQVESHMMGIINSEAMRPFSDYLELHEARPNVVFMADGRQLDPDHVRVHHLSPLALRDPPKGWMTLHFQITPQGIVGSPQIPDQNSVWAIDVAQFSVDFYRRARGTWAWLERNYANLDFRGRIASAFRYDREESIDPSYTNRDAALAGLQLSKKKSSRLADSRQQRQALHAAQAGYLPIEQCLHPDVAAQNIRSLPLRGVPTPLGDATAAEEVTFSIGSFAPAIWIDGFHKLAFVRDARVDAEIYYQGFIADWNSLKAELLAEIEGVFPDADLEPIANDAELDDETAFRKMPYLPAVIRVPEIPGGVSAAAWASIQWQLLMSWAGAAAVLVIAGFGVRNLMALTNRRMQFAYAVTHELRTPLTTFRLYSDMLSAGLVPDSARQEYLETLHRESIRLSRLVEEVLEYARLENQKIRLHIADTDAPAILDVVGETLEKACRQNGIQGQTVNHISNGMPVRTDVNVVNQIAGVLVNNACRHARGSEKPMVLVELGGTDGRVHLDVIDTGTGVDRSDARRIFKPFRRGRDADRAARGGIGLGLALARNWATLLGGRLDLVARHHPKHRGAHFRLTFPTDGGQN